MDNDELNLAELEKITSGFNIEMELERLQSEYEKANDPNEKQMIITQIQKIEESLQGIKGINK